MSNTSPTPAPVPPADAHNYATAYASVRDEIAAVKDDDLVRMNVDVYLAANRVNGALPRLRVLAVRLAALPEYDAKLVEKIDVYGHAAVHAHLLYLATQPPKEEIESLYKEVFDLRDVLYTEVVAFCRRKLLDESRLTALRGAVGYRNAAFDLLLLATMIIDHSAALQGRMVSTLAEVEAARDKAHRLNEFLNIKENNDAAAPAFRTKHQAYSLFLRAYDEARRGLTFLRWREEDVDDILPTIYPKKRRDGDPDETAPIPQPAPSPVAPVAGAPQPTPGTVTTGATPAGPALPGGGPFGR